MKKSLVLFFLLLNLLAACNGPSPEKKPDIVQADKITRDTDVLLSNPTVHFIKSAADGYDYYDERYIRYYDIPVQHMRFSVAEDKVHLEHIFIDLFKKKEDIKSLKDKLTAVYGQPGADSTRDFSMGDNENVLVWKNDHQLIGLNVEKDFETAPKIEKAPSLSILFIKPEAPQTNE